eukprot:CAMPEP_0176343880 /NCGR_PEP_ID=MMETSP0126-20121128/4259_1 /TAXON_ID=141414 ORGANISM="Strombidinopsis acuminatum, Strain SPMC142" /NCGR_SAMPLE_ID=MMETSP0126 /ASSEMBLY_ACC=CAM_ASM_000229 /LENGTH=83 /DNA_ID=CAMNT_0017690017 /DNA_START=44 /DNA_END=295 /DNA_ORIENTATION=+
MIGGNGGPYVSVDEQRIYVLEQENSRLKEDNRLLKRDNERIVAQLYGKSIPEKDVVTSEDLKAMHIKRLVEALEVEKKRNQAL